MIRQRRSMADLFAAVRAPESRIGYYAAIGHRASRIVGRVEPIRAARHGFYDPQGFVEDCQRMGRRNQLYRELCARLSEKEAARGRPAPDQPAAIRSAA